MADVALVPEGHVLEPGTDVGAQHARQPRQPLARDGVALVGHGGAALLPRPEGLLDLADLGALKVAHLGGELLDRCSGARARPEVLGVTVACDHLGGRHRREAERLAHLSLDPGVDVGIRAHRARELAHGHRLARPAQARAVAVRLEAPQCELGPEGDGLGVHPVGATDHGRGPELDRPALERGDQLAASARQQVGRLCEGGAQGGVDDVARREPVVDPLAGRSADGCLDDVDERRHVVVGDPLAFGHRLDERGRGLRGALADRLGLDLRHDTDGRERLGRQHLDLEPPRQASLVGEQGGHGGTRVAADHPPLRGP